MSFSKFWLCSLVIAAAAVGCSHRESPDTAASLPADEPSSATAEALPAGGVSSETAAAPEEVDPEAPEADLAVSTPEVDSTQEPETLAPLDEATSEPGAPAEADPALEAPLASTASEPATLTVREVIERVDDAVVLIKIEDAQGREKGVGSGFVVDRSGLVATNYHVMRMANSAHAQLHNGERIDIEGVRAFDKGRDLAVVQLRDPPSDLEVVPLDEPRQLLQGDTLIAVGHPHGFKFTVTTGIVSAVRSTDELPDQFKRFSQWPDDQVWIQTNAAISHGNSGGPLFDQRGTLVGINTWIDPQGQNLGFATHVQHLAELMQELPGELHPLPINGSMASRALTNPQVIGIQEAFERDYREFRKKKSSLFGLLNKPQHPAGKRVQELLEFAEQHPGNETGFQALAAAAAVARTDQEETEDELKQVLELLVEKHAEHPRLDNVAIEVGMIGEPHTLAFQRELLARSPHRHVQAAACYYLAVGHHYSDESPAVQPQVAHYWRKAMEEFGDVYLELYERGASMNLGKTAERLLFRTEHATIGKTPPNIVGSDHAGEPLELNDFRGNVVLLTFSADWDEDCRELYEHKRTWVKKYEDQPFVVLDVSKDTPDRLAHLVSENTVTWRSWPDGADGPIAKSWHISSVPAVILLDREGVVRLTLVARSDEAAETIEKALEQTLAQPYSLLPEDVLASGASWRYRLAADEIGDSWKEPEYDDGEWRQGPAPIGFGQFDEATPLELDPTATEQWTTLLRTSFDIADPQAAADFVVSLEADDGAAVYVNGTEVVRHGLSADSSVADEATFNDPIDGRIDTLYVIDAGKFVSGRNVVAVQVHQADGSSDLRFGLSISSNVVSDLLEKIASGDSIRRLDALQTLGRVGPAAAAALPQLDELIQDDDMQVRSRALEAALLIDPKRADEPLPEPTDKEEQEFRKHLNHWLNNASWSLGFAKDNTAANYELAWRYINAAYALAPKEGAAVNTKGTVEYRLGRYADAIATLNESLRLMRDNPFDHAIIAMAHYQLDQSAEAALALKRAQNALERVEPAERQQAESLVHEAEELIGEPQEDDSTPFE